MPAISHLNPTWEHTLTDILNHDSKTQMGIIMRAWVKDNNMTDFTSMLTYTADKFTLTGFLCYYKEKVDAETPTMMTTNLLQELYNLRRYITHVMNESDYDPDDPDFDHPLSEHNWLSQTRGKFMKYVIYTLSDGIESRPIPNKNQKLISFKKGIKREETAYPTLKDERYFDGFSRSLYITAKSHECEQVLDPDYTPNHAEKDFFEANQIFMFSVVDKHLLTDMGKTIVRKYVHTTDAQSVWKDFQDHMKSSSKGASEKRRLTQYVTNTTLDDNYKGTTEQFVLHFNEQFRQLEEISDPSEHFPPQIKLQLLQNAVRPIDDLRIVETLDEFQSTTTGYGRSSSLKYQTYYNLLINACVRYDRTKKANIAKRGHIYQTSSTPDNDGFNDEIPYETPGRDPYMGIDTPSDEFYNIHTTQYVPPMSARHKLQPRLPKPNQSPETFPKKQTKQRWTGPIYLPAHIYKLLSQEVKDALQKYNAEAIQKFKSTRNLHEINFLDDLHENTQDNSTTSNQDDQSPDYQESHPDQDLEPPMDDLLDFSNSQNHSDDQLDQVLQTYQTYTESQSPTRQVNAHMTYHVAQANQAMHQSFVDREANGGLAGSDVRVLNTSPRQCTVIGINNHEIPGLDIVQCAALVNTNNGIVNLIMNEYAYYGKGHTIHLSGQIEWHTNTVDDISVQVGGQQRIITIDGNSMPLVCKGGLMYLKFQGIPTDKDLQTYPSVHLTSPQEWDPSVLDYVHPKDNGEPNSTYDSTEKYQVDTTFDESDDYINKLLSITPQISSTHHILVNKHNALWGGTVDFFPMKRHLISWNPEDKFPHHPGGSIFCQLIKYLKKFFAI